MDIFVDTNILVRRIHRTDPKHRATRGALGTLARRGDQLCLSSQILEELWTVCTRPAESNGLSLSIEHTNRIISRVEAVFTRLPDVDDIYQEWKRLVVAHKVSGKRTHDARIVAAMNVHGVNRLLTFNTGDFSAFTGILCLRPDEVQASPIE